MCAAALALGACGGAPPRPDGPGPDVATATVVPKPNFYLRTGGFDDDPSAYLGRFVDDAATPGTIDESSARRTQCSQLVTVKRVRAGGQFDEYFTASTEGGASLGGMGVAVGGGRSEGQAYRVRYTLTDRWIAEPADPAAFAACCAQAAGLCSKRMIGEFIGGEGELLSSAGREVDARVETPAGALEARDGYAWRRSMRIDPGLFFAFRLTSVDPGGGGHVAGVCETNWKASKPRTAAGTYFVGVSEAVDSERAARETALRDARLQVVTWLNGETLRSEGVEATGAAAEKRLTFQSEGVARFIDDRCTDVERIQVPGQFKYKASVLMLLPKAQEDAARQAIGPAR